MIALPALVQVCRQDFRAFVEKSFEILNPGTAFLDTWHIGAIAHVLEEMRLGANRRQIINMPPRTLKSQITSVCWPAFLLGHDPATEIIVVSYAETLAEQLSSDTRRLMQSDFYATLFPQTRLERQSSLHLSTDQNGCRIGTTVGGSVTGLGANWIIIDDPHNASEAQSEPARNKVKHFFQHTLLSRLNNPADGRFLLVMQRLHEADLAGHLLGQGVWRHLKLQARATEDAQIPVGPRLIHDVRDGDLLHPQLLPAHWLDAQKNAMGSAAFEAQYQQQPAPAEGNMIKREWLRYCDAPPRDSGRVTLSFDTATKDNTENDYSVCTVWLDVQDRHHLINVWRDKVNFPTLRRKVLDLIDVFRPHAVLIEDAGSGSALIQELHSRGVPAIARKAKDPKVVRLNSASAFIESALMWLPKEAPWLDNLEAELLGFPGARYDDQVDSLSQYFNWIRERPKAIFEFEWM